MRCLFIILGGFLFLAISAGVAVWFFYAEEDSRGAREWIVTKENLQKAGETIDFNDLIPPEIPDEQNLGAIPLFQVEPDSDAYHSNPPIALKKALANLSPESSPLPGRWMVGETAEMAPIEKYLAARYQKVFGKAGDNLGAMEKIDALCPALNDLRQANAARPQIRLQQDYTSQPAYNRPMSLAMQVLYLAKAINLHAISALRENKADVALDDTKIAIKLNGGFRQMPILISGLVAAAMMSVQFGSIWEGLNQHAWNDQQLAELQKELQEIDFLSDYQLCMRGEAIGFFAQTQDYLREHRRSAAQTLFVPSIQLITEWDGGPTQWPAKPSVISRFGAWLIPKGWFDMIKARCVSLDYQAARESADPAAHRVDPQKAKQFEQRIQSLNMYDPPNVIVRIGAEAVIYSIESFSEAQFRVDAAYIACALERYRLAHGVYPNSLDALTPYAPQGLPHDLINGEAYHYTLLADGDYLLYSVGWNQVDDGGKVIYEPGTPKVLDQERGDWVWPRPKIK